MHIRRAVIWRVLLLGIVSGCNSAAPASHESLASLDPIRAAFNADSGKVRAIFLASPT